MLQPKAYSKEKQKVYDVKYIDFDNETLELLTEQQFDFYAHVYDFDEVEFMENTGMKDENGKYIYVGDIVKDGDDIYTIKRSEVYKILSMSDKKLSIFLGECTCREIEVIGNLYENKELLE